MDEISITNRIERLREIAMIFSRAIKNSSRIESMWSCMRFVILLIFTLIILIFDMDHSIAMEVQVGKIQELELELEVEVL